MSEKTTNWTYTTEIQINGTWYRVVARDEEALRKPDDWEIGKIAGPTSPSNPSKAGFSGKLKFGNGFRSTEQWPHELEYTAEKVKLWIGNS